MRPEAAQMYKNGALQAADGTNISLANAAFASCPLLTGSAYLIKNSR